MTRSICDNSYEYTVRCPARVSSRWLRSRLPSAGSDSRVLLDLSDCRTLAPLAQNWIIDYCAAQYPEANLTIDLLLPEEPYARINYTGSGILPVLAELLGRKVEDFVLNVSNAEVDQAVVSRKRWSIDDHGPKSWPVYLFPFHLYDANHAGFSPAGALTESARWHDPYVLAVLNRLFGANAKKIATHIVQEAALAAIKREGTTVIVTSAVLSSEALILTIWDNGKPSTADFEALTLPTAEYRSITVRPLPDVEVEVNLQGYSPHEARHDMANDGDVEAETRKTVLKLLASNAPGGWREHTFDDPKFLALLGGVVDLFDGELALLSGSLGARICQTRSVVTDSEVYRYAANVVRYPNSSRAWGNITSATLPIGSPSLEIGGVRNMGMKTSQ